uniref:F-box/LRR-repeat protein 6 n=1 Tax=Myxine glutinosa TaxID=7769 RepID=UPI00358FE6E7
MMSRSRTSEEFVRVVERSDNDVLLVSTLWRKPVKRAFQRKKKIRKAQVERSCKLAVKRKNSLRASSTISKTKLDDIFDGTSSGEDLQCRFPNWGSELPELVLFQIFEEVLKTEGAVPFLCRVSQVCWRWQQVACNPLLWRHVRLSYCWTKPMCMNYPSAPTSCIQQTLRWLTKQRLQQMDKFELVGWGSTTLVNFALMEVKENCKSLRSISLEGVALAKDADLATLAKECPNLQALHLKNTRAEISSLEQFFKLAGNRLHELSLTITTCKQSILDVLARYCTVLRVLDLDSHLGAAFGPEQSRPRLPQLSFALRDLQKCCRELEVLRILNVDLEPRKASIGEGFPALRELVLASVNEGIYIDDALLFAMAGCSTHLQVLDLRGSNRVTPQGLMALPSEELVELYLGVCGPFKLPFRTRICWARDSISVLQRWGGSLLSLDLTGQAVTDTEVVEIIHRGRGSNLRHLALGGTQITEHILGSILKSCSQLHYLNLTGCRCLPRDMKRVYDGPEPLQDLLTRLGK